MARQSAHRTFGRVASQRRALVRNLAVSLIEHEAITTSEAKAKELRPFVEKLITKAAKGTVGARRLLVARLGGNVSAARKLTLTLAPRYETRRGGYTRITKLPARASDAGTMARIEFV